MLQGPARLPLGCHAFHFSRCQDRVCYSSRPDLKLRSITATRQVPARYRAIPTLVDPGLSGRRKVASQGASTRTLGLTLHSVIRGLPLIVGASFERLRLS